MKKIRVMCVVEMEDEVPDDRTDFCGAEMIAYGVRKALKEYFHSITRMTVKTQYCRREVVCESGETDVSEYGRKK